MWAGQRDPQLYSSWSTHGCHELLQPLVLERASPTPPPLHALVFLHPIAPSHGSGCPCHPMTLGVLWCHQCQDWGTAQCRNFTGIPTPANPHLAAQPTSQSCAAAWPFLPHAASTNHNQAAPWSDQSYAATWHFPTTNHVLPLVSAAASPLAAAAHQSQHEGDCIKPIRSCCLPSVPASQGQPRPARSYKGPLALGLSQQLGSSQEGGGIWKGLPPARSQRDAGGRNVVVFWCPIP